MFKFICCLEEKEEKIWCACMNWSECRKEGTQYISSGTHTVKFRRGSGE